MHNYTLVDLLGALRAWALFPIFLIAPGYLAGWSLNLLKFRDKGIEERTLLSVTLSVGLTPAIAALISRIAPLSAVNGLFLGITALFIACLAAERNVLRGQANRGLERGTKILLFAMGAWTVVALGILIDIQIGDRLYLSTSVFDHSIRTAFTRSILKNGIPPVNPLFYPGHAIPLHYYYYWYLLCALPAKLGAIDPRLSVIASCVWAGFALAATIPLYLKYFLGERNRLRSSSLFGIALLLVTGLDLLPTILYLVTPGHVLFAEMEWWDSEIIGSWLSSLLWAPHHIAALVACLSGFLLIWTIEPSSTLGERVKAALIAGLAFASAGGLSIYVAFTFCVFLFLWGIAGAFRRQWTEIGLLATSGLVAILLSIPYLQGLQASGSSSQFAVWGLRWHTGDSLRMAGIQSVALHHIASILEMPLMYLLELGFFFAVGVLRLWQAIRQHRSLSRSEAAAWVMVGSSLFIASFLKSDVILANDLGIRSVLLAQFVLLLWGAPLLAGWSKGDIAQFQGPAGSPVRPWTLRLMLLLGFAATVYQATLMRTYSFVHDNTTGSPDYRMPSKDLGPTVYAIRSAYDEIDRVLPASAVVQANPWIHISFPYPLYSTRRSVTSIPGCGVPFSGKGYEGECHDIQLTMGRAFNSSDWLATKFVDNFCDQFFTDALLVTSYDPIWRSPNSWVWQRTPLFANQFVRVIGCGSRQSHAAARSQDRLP
ncbi:MAG TPA: hypothetical protein VKZ53_08595 [Candidatus Angelobacter sp.]|nr:hypothetical protein [Candidatus Angelobacter sp.]